MHVLFDQGVYDLRNKGNVALLQVAVSRIHEMWPNASLEVITSAPHLLRLYCPQATPVHPDAQYDWRENKGPSDRILTWLPRPVLRLLFEVREEMWQHGSGKELTRILRRSASQNSVMDRIARPSTGRNTKDMPHRLDTLDSSLRLLRGVDLFVATGAQYMSDACRDDALRVLDRLAAAHRLGIPTAMVGQGLGPFRDAELRARVSAVVPLVDLIFVRDERSALPFLDQLGVDRVRVFFTADDAIEMAYNARTPLCGSCIGVSFRIAPYTEGTPDHIAKIGPVLQRARAHHDARLISIPISHSLHERDDQVLQDIVGARKGVHWNRRFDTPLEIIKRVGQCRLVVTGTFHTAVFALSQGIPAICLGKSDMYVGKFASLMDQFGSGCRLISLDDPRLQDRLDASINWVWESAEQLKPQLLDSASRQIEMGQTAYRRLYQLVELANRQSLRR